MPLAAYLPQVLNDPQMSLNVMIIMAVGFLLLSLSMVYVHKIIQALLAASLSMIFLYAIVALMVWQDVANRSGQLLMADSGLGYQGTSGVNLAQLPDLAINAPLYMAIFFAVIAMLMRADEMLKSSSRQRAIRKGRKAEAKLSGS